MRPILGTLGPILLMKTSVLFVAPTNAAYYSQLLYVTYREKIFRFLVKLFNFIHNNAYHIYQLNAGKTQMLYMEILAHFSYDSGSATIGRLSHRKKHFEVISTKIMQLFKEQNCVQLAWCVRYMCCGHENKIFSVSGDNWGIKTI